jgi:hypothetical protein
LLVGYYHRFTVDDYGDCGVGGADATDGGVRYDDERAARAAVVGSLCSDADAAAAALRRSERARAAVRGEGGGGQRMPRA